jgi:cathepsin A (carboxypeptidase C)
MKLTIGLILFLSLNAKLSERVWSEFFPEPQLHGLIKLDEKEEDDIFYWLFPSRNSPDTDPLVLWLTGGPGCSSELAVFVENGPMELKEGEAVKKEISWNNKANLLFIDQPIGTGYSRTKGNHHPRTEEEVRQQFGKFILKFYQKFPEFKDRKFFITGESYAGHYIPFIAEHLMDHPKRYRDAGVNLQGVAIGNGWVNPAT